MTDDVTARTPLICSDERHTAKVTALETENDRLTAELGDYDKRVQRLDTELAALRAVARGYCPACGRGDAAPTVEHWEQQRDRADRAEAALADMTRDRDRQQWYRDDALRKLRIHGQRADEAERQRDGINRMYLNAMGDLGIAINRLDQIRDAARLHQQQLISTREMYAAIDADDQPAPAETPAADKPA